MGFFTHTSEVAKFVTSCNIDMSGPSPDDSWALMYVYFGLKHLPCVLGVAGGGTSGGGGVTSCPGLPSLTFAYGMIERMAVLCASVVDRHWNPAALHASAF